MRYRVYLLLVDRSNGLLQITAGFKSMTSTCWGVLLEVSFYWFVASHIASFHIPRCDVSRYSKTQCITSSDPAMIWIQHWKQGTFCGLALPQTPAVVMVWRRWNQWQLVNMATCEMLTDFSTCQCCFNRRGLGSSFRKWGRSLIKRACRVWLIYFLEVSCTKKDGGTWRLSVLHRDCAEWIGDHPQWH